MGKLLIAHADPELDHLGGEFWSILDMESKCLVHSSHRGLVQTLHRAFHSRPSQTILAIYQNKLTS